MLSITNSLIKKSVVSAVFLCVFYERNMFFTIESCCFFMNDSRLFFYAPGKRPIRPASSVPRLTYPGAATFAFSAVFAFVVHPRCRDLRIFGHFRVGRVASVTRFTRFCPFLRWSCNPGAATYAFSAQNAFVAHPGRWGPRFFAALRMTTGAQKVFRKASRACSSVRPIFFLMR